MAGMSKFEYKMKRAMRRRNHIALDLATPKYRQRVKKKRRYYDDEEDYEEDV